MKINVVFDNGGGTTLLYSNGDFEYRHYYEDAKQAASDYIALMTTPVYDIKDWDGNNTEENIVYDADMERNGGYKWLDIDDVNEMTKQEFFNWVNMSLFFKELNQLMKS